MSPKGNKFQHRQLRLIQTSIRPDLISVRDSSGKSVHPTEKVQLFVLPLDDAAPEAWLTRVQGLDVLRSLRLGPLPRRPCRYRGARRLPKSFAPTTCCFWKTMPMA